MDKPAQLIFIPALDPHLSQYGVDDDFQDRQVRYGMAMLKASLVLATTPVLAEYQIVDGTALLREAGRSEGLRSLIYSGDIVPSYWHKDGYRQALLDKLNRPDWISSAWPEETRKRLARNLPANNLTPPSDEEDRLKELYEGLLFFQSFQLGRPQQMLLSGTSAIVFSEMLANVADKMHAPGGAAMLDPINHAKEILRAATVLVPKESLQNRSAYISILESESFQETHRSESNGEDYILARQALFFASQRVISQAVAGGAWLNSMAVAESSPDLQVPAPVPTTDVLLPLYDSYGGMNSPSCLVVDDLNVEALDALSWETIQRLRTQPEFLRAKVNQAQLSFEGRMEFRRWLQTQLVGGEAELSALERLVAKPSRLGELLPKGLSIEGCLLGLAKDTLNALAKSVVFKGATKRQWTSAGRVVTAVERIGKQIGLL